MLNSPRCSQYSSQKLYALLQTVPAGNHDFYDVFRINGRKTGSLHELWNKQKVLQNLRITQQSRENINKGTKSHMWRSVMSQHMIKATAVHDVWAHRNKPPPSKRAPASPDTWTHHVCCVTSCKTLTCDETWSCFLQLENTTTQNLCSVCDIISTQSWWCQCPALLTAVFSANSCRLSVFGSKNVTGLLTWGSSHKYPCCKSI